MNSDTDFSSINYQFLLKVRDAAKQDPDMVAPLLGIPRELVEPLIQTPASAFTVLISIKEPLIMLRAEPWWWERFIKALNDGTPEEVEAIIEHAGFIASSMPEDEGR